VKPGTVCVVQVPPAQLRPDGHITPQAPQLRASPARLVSQPLATLLSQLPKPVEQLMRQVALLHEAVPLVLLHAAPQAPQLEGSFCTSRQVPLHTVCPLGHVDTQTPAEHTVPDAHTRPQAPQFDRSVCKSRQAPLHSVSPAVHRQAPEAQI
jgi:hypothetical protein